jgi:hypothetical protein
VEGGGRREEKKKSETPICETWICVDTGLRKEGVEEGAGG